MSNSTLVVAVGQLRSMQSIEANLEVCRRLMAKAARQGVELIAFPENTPFLGREDERLALVEPLDGPTISALRAMAAEHAIAVLVGSFSETGPRPTHSYNTSVLISSGGEVVAVYRKMHLFDVAVDDGPSFKESDSIEAGTEPVLAELAGFNFGLTICYDLRFAELYRLLRQQGAHVLTVPSAFTERTGRDHWEVLLRARAIENQCWVIAPNQWGHHIRGRDSYGHSMIIDPWGTVVARAPDGVGLAIAEISLERVEAVRRQIPCQAHRKL